MNDNLDIKTKDFEEDFDISAQNVIFDVRLLKKMAQNTIWIVLFIVSRLS